MLKTIKNKRIGKIAGMGVIVLLFCCFFNTSTLNIMKPENVYARAENVTGNRKNGGHGTGNKKTSTATGSNEDCYSVIGKDLTNILKDVFLWIEISVPCITLVLCTVDITKAVIAQDEKEIKKAQGRAIKRIIIGVAIFLVPVILNVLLSYTGVIASGTCGIGG